MAALMIQGCGSDVGKSTLVAGLCRLFANRGLQVRPFKPQNMSNNAAVTNGGEIGRAQDLQALACRTPPTVHMNPVLLKPESDRGAQIVLRGKASGRLDAAAYPERKAILLPVVLESFRELQREADLVLIEGAGSPAETNLREGDIANMGFAHAADVPVVLVGDIDRGHVIAQLVGAHAVLSDEDRGRIQGFVINKFRGDLDLFAAGRGDIAARTGWRDLGVCPWSSAVRRLPSEDGVRLETRTGSAAPRRVKIVAPLLSRISNVDDFDALRDEEEVDFQFVPQGCPLPGDADLVILPGTKSTLTDLAFLRQEGWDIDLYAHVRRGGRVLGLCGGFQMLGNRILDPLGLDGPPGEAEGLRLLDLVTRMTSSKTVRAVRGALAQGGAFFSGYEIHCGESAGPALERPLLRLENGRSEGATSRDGRISGAYVHGLFNCGDARRRILRDLGAASNGRDRSGDIEELLNELASLLETSLDVRALAGLAGL